MHARRARFFLVDVLANEKEVTGKTSATPLTSPNPNIYVKFIFPVEFPLTWLQPPAFSRIISKSRILSISSTDKPVSPQQPRHEIEASALRTITLHCDITTRSPVTFRWFKEGSDITDIPRYSYQDNRRKLVICSPTEADGGNYSCEARNAVGSAEYEVKLTVIPTDETSAAGN